MKIMKRIYWMGINNKEMQKWMFELYAYKNQKVSWIELVFLLACAVGTFISIGIMVRKWM